MHWFYFYIHPWCTGFISTFTLDALVLFLHSPLIHPRKAGFVTIPFSLTKSVTRFSSGRLFVHCLVAGYSRNWKNQGGILVECQLADSRQAVLYSEQVWTCLGAVSLGARRGLGVGWGRLSQRKWKVNREQAISVSRARPFYRVYRIDRKHYLSATSLAGGNRKTNSTYSGLGNRPLNKFSVN